MDTEQAQWVTQLRKIPITFQHALRTADDRAIRIALLWGVVSDRSARPHD